MNSPGSPSEMVWSDAGSVVWLNLSGKESRWTYLWYLWEPKFRWPWLDQAGSPIFATRASTEQTCFAQSRLGRPGRLVQALRWYQGHSDKLCVRTVTATSRSPNIKIFSRPSQPKPSGSFCHLVRKTLTTGSYHYAIAVWPCCTRPDSSGRPCPLASLPARLSLPPRKGWNKRGARARAALQLRCEEYCKYCAVLLPTCRNLTTVSSAWVLFTLPISRPVICVIAVLASCH